MDTPTKQQLVPLHVHTNYSVLDGASGISDYIKWCKENDSPGLGITDHGWVIGLRELIEKSKDAGITPLPGCEFYLIPPVDYPFKGKPYDYFHITIWAINEVGYRNLLKLGSISFQKDIINGKKRVVSKFGSEKPRITFDELFSYHEGLVAGSGCLIGTLNKGFLNGEWSGAIQNLSRLLEVFKGRLFVEILPHSCTHDYDRKTKAFKPNECTDFSPDGDLQKACNLANIKIAREFNLPLLMTVDSHFVKPEEKSVQDVLLQNGDDSGWRFFNSYHQLTTEQAWEHWRFRYGSDIEQRRIFAEAVENNHLIVEMAKDFNIKDSYRQPAIDLQGEPDLESLILKKVMKHGRMRPEWAARLKYELDVICHNGTINFSPYFLFLEQWAEWTRKHSILSAPGRGSAAGSLLCYLLKITHLNPFKQRLPFERFLSLGRIKRKKYPDIDWDCSDRDPLLSKLKETYGDKMAQCSTHGTLRIKSAIKDACRVILKWNSDDPRVNEITKPIPMTPTGVSDRDFLLGYVDPEGNIHQGYLEQDKRLQDFFNQYSTIYEMVLKLIGIPRSVGRHASSYFISDSAISDSVPTCTISDEICTQYTAAWAEKSGLIKFDFLRVNTLSDISSAIRLIQKRLGYRVEEREVLFNRDKYTVIEGDLEIDQLPMRDGRILDVYDLPEDPAVFDDLCEGKTETIFQLQTSALTSLTKRIKPRSVEEISALVALVRPGPMQGFIEDGQTTMTEAYIRRKHGEMSVTYPHPDMEPILKDTFGIMAYQEQVAACFSDLLGYSAEEADEMRERIGKKKKQDMEAMIPALRKRIKEKRWTEAQEEMFVSACIAASQYSFNRAHSASYAAVAYQCAFIKHYYPLEWWTAVLQNAKVEDIKEKGYVAAVKKILILPHINGPMRTFELRDDGKIHAPLYLIDGIGDAACLSIDEERKKNGLYTSFQNFYDRMNKTAIDLGVMHSMILCGVFDQLHPNEDPKNLTWLYHAFRRVQGLKIGKGKTGSDLTNAVAEFLKKGGTVDSPVLFEDRIELELKRITLLPIHRSNLLNDFKDYMRAKGILIDNEGFSTSGSIVVCPNKESLKQFLNQDKTVSFVGFVSDVSEFSYTDRRSHKKVKALKFNIINDGDSLECVIWPNQYAQIGKPISRILCVSGNVKTGRDGSVSMFVSSFQNF